MQIRRIEITTIFERHYRKLPALIKELANEKDGLFRRDPHAPVLRTHKLHGKDHDAWAFGVTNRYRIKFIFLTPDTVLYLDIGTHDIYE